MVAALLALSFSVAAFENESSGFRGIEWGTLLSTLKDKMTPTENAGGLDVYTRIGDKLLIGDIELQNISYVFYKDRFHSVIINSKPIVIYDMVNLFRKQFGPGYKVYPSAEQYLWEGTKSTIYLNCSPGRNTCMANIRSVIMTAEQQHDKDVAARGAKKDF